MGVRVAVAYHTGYGKTGSLAQAVARGAASVEHVAVDLLNVSELDEAGWAALDAADAIILRLADLFRLAVGGDEALP